MTLLPSPTMRGGREREEKRNRGHPPERLNKVPEEQNSKGHDKGKRKSTWDKHTKRRPGRSTTKDRLKPGFKPRTPPRPQDLEPKEE